MAKCVASNYYSERRSVNAKARLSDLLEEGALN